MFVVGDVNGSMHGLHRNLLAMGAVDPKGNWIGGEEPCLIIGDILADRQITGLECLLYIAQMKRQGANVTVLAGNHDEWAISFLLCKQSNAYFGDDPASLPLIQCLVNQGQGIGLAEFASFGPPPLQELWGQILKRERPFPPLDQEGIDHFLEGMAEGADPSQNFWALLFMSAREIANALPDRIRNEIVSMELAHRFERYLFLHTPPIASMLNRLMLQRNLCGGTLDEGIEKTNYSFTSFMQDNLGRDTDASQDKRFMAFSLLSATFLDTGNRDIQLDEQMARMLTDEGITHIIYGHNRDGVAFIEDPASFRHHGIQFVPVDFGYSPSPELDHLRSIARITSDQVLLGKDLVPIP